MTGFSPFGVIDIFLPTFLPSSSSFYPFFSKIHEGTKNFALFRQEERQLRLSSVIKIIRGQRTANFQRQLLPDRDEQSFSLIYASGESTLDLICKDKLQADSWFMGLRAVITKCHQSRTTGNFGSCRGAQSCINSPAGFIRRKQNLGLLEETAEFSQIRSLCGSPSLSVEERCLSNGFSCSSDGFYFSESSLSRAYDVSDALAPLSPFTETDNLKNNSSQRFLAPTLVSPGMESNEILKDMMIWGAVGGFIDGLNSQNDALFPKLLESTKMLDVKNIAFGGKHAALVTKQGEVFCWGDGTGGKLGLRVNMDVNHPTHVDSLNGVTIESVACGEYQSCAVSDSGELYTWGSGGNNIDENKCHFLPHKLSDCLNSSVSVLKVACGEWHTAIISTSGKLFTYGDGTFGVLGHGNTENVSKPKEVESFKGLKVKSVSCGPWHTAAIAETTTVDLCCKFNANNCGKLFTWGDGDKGRLGHADGERKLVPTCVSQLVNYDFTQVTCGWTLTVALTTYGTVYTMGSAVHGQLGSPRAKDKAINIVEGKLRGQFVKEISSGSYHIAVLTSFGSVYTWGKGGNGQLGLGDTKDRNSPALVEALCDRLVENIFCGLNMTAAICLHKDMSLSDQSACSSCKLLFGFTRKKHNCYNCGLLFCHACSSRKAVNASLAPNKGKCSRVCDPCFDHLRKISDLGLSLKVESRSPRLLMTPRRIADDVKEKPEIHLNKDISPENLGAKQKAPEANLSVNRHPRWGQVSTPSMFCDTNSLPSFSSSGSQSASNVGATSPARVSRGPSSLSESNKILTYEVERLRAKVKNLEVRCELGEQKIQECRRQIGETWLLAKEEAAKCKAAKDVIKVLALRLHAMKEKVSTAKEMKNSVICHPSQVSPICDDSSFLPYLTPIATHSHSEAKLPKERQEDNSCTSPSVSSDTLKSITGRNSTRKSGRLVDVSPVTRKEFQQNETKFSKSECVEQYEPGVYITFTSLPSGEKGLKRVRFSRKRFTEKEAQRWWEENQAEVYSKYGTEGYTNSDQNQ